MLEVCAAVEILSMTIPLVPPAAFVGTDTALVTVVGGHAGLPVTLMDMTQPWLLVRHPLPRGMGLAMIPLFALFPMLKKIQSLSIPAPAPFGLSNSVMGEHASLPALARAVRALPTLVRVPVAAAKLS